MPSRLIPKNVAEQRKWKLDDEGNLSEVVKDRVTTDDSVELDDGELGSHNNTLPRDDWPDTKLPGPKTLAEAVAIIKAASRRLGLDRAALNCEKVALWALDLSDAFRSLAGQEAEKWQHGFVWVDGVRIDERCVFGSAHMVGVFQRVTTFVLAIVAAKIAAYDSSRPYSKARRRWCEVRSQLLGEPQRCDFQCIYLDDGMGISVLEEGELLRARGDGESRAQAHLRIACETFIEAGWGVATAKVQLGLRIDPLGLSVTSEGKGALSCPEVKRQGMLADIAKQLQPEASKGTSRSARRRRLERGGADSTIPREEVERLTGRCLHLSAVEPGANPYMRAMYRIKSAKRKVASSGGVPVYALPRRLAVGGDTPGQAAYRESLLWWQARLEAGLVVPLAPRLVFPRIGAPKCALICTDAARGTGRV